MATDSRDPIPADSTAEHGAALLKAALSAVPVVGGPAAELFAYVLAPVLSKRRDEWLEDLAVRVFAIEGATPERLANDRAFVTTAMHATQIALRTHQQEKLDALRNAVVNVAAKSAPDDDLQPVFLSFVDTFTALHLRVLMALEHAGPGIPDELKPRPEIDLILADLLSRGLISNPKEGTWDSLGPTDRIQVPWLLRPLGRSFIDFISGPAS